MTIARTHSKKRRTAKILIGLVIAIVVIRLVLPYIILHFANKSLANMNGYYGHINDIDLAIFRGAYQIDSIYINKVEWKALFKGSIVGELVFQRPYLLLAQKLRNSYDSSAVLPASIHATADVYEGKLRFDAKLNPLANAPTFDMSAELTHTNLVKLNDFFQAYAKVDVNDGRFGL